MQLKQIYRGVVAGLGLVVVTNACAPDMAYTQLRASSERRPGWIDTPDMTVTGSKVFIGLSGRVRHERDARDQAIEDAMTQIAQYTGVTVSQVSELIVHSQSGRTTSSESQLSTYTKQSSDTYIRSVGDVNWYVVEFERATGNGVEPAFEAHVRIVVPESQLKQMQAEKAHAEHEQSALARALARQALLADVVKSTAGIIPWQGQSANGSTDWYAGKSRVTARGFVDKSLTNNRAQLETMAMSAARQMAYAGLNELINGVEVRSETATSNQVVNRQSVIVRHEGRVHGRVVDEKVLWQGDEVVGEVTVESTLNSGGMYLDYTRGVIIVARNMGFMPDLMARVVTISGEELLGPAFMQSGNLSLTGTFLYADSMNKAISLLHESAVPLVLKPVNASRGVLQVDLAEAGKVSAYLSGALDRERVPVIVVF